MLVFALKYNIISSPRNDKKVNYYCKATSCNKNVILLYPCNGIILYLGDDRSFSARVLNNNI